MPGWSEMQIILLESLLSADSEEEESLRWSALENTMFASFETAIRGGMKKVFPWQGDQG